MGWTELVDSQNQAAVGILLLQIISLPGVDSSVQKKPVITAKIPTKFMAVKNV
jgi:hypothetical protein